MMLKTVILSPNAKSVIEFIKKSGISCFSDYSNNSVSENISDHADISFFFDGDDTLFIAKESEKSVKFLNEFCKNVIVISENLGNNYPEDVKLNCIRLGDYFICNLLTVSPDVLIHMKNKGMKIIDVKQGYTKCSVLPVSDNALITDDVSIYKSCMSAGLDVLYVSKGDVKLNGFDYGFIGGCAGRISKNLIVFCGNIKKHRDYKIILDFLDKYNVKYYCSDDELTDVGSILPVYKV